MHGCLGEAVTPEAKCLRHAAPEVRNSYLTSLGGRNKSLSLRGVAVDQALADAILQSPSFAEKRVDVYMSLAGAEVSGRLSFEGCTFAQGIDVTGAIIQETGSFQLRGCELQSSLSTQSTFFNASPPNIAGCTFGGEVFLDYAHVEWTSISFGTCTFKRKFEADGVVGALMLRRCQFDLDLFIRAADATVIILDDCEVAREIDVAGTRCLAFRTPYLRALSAHQLGPLNAKNDVSLARARFGARIRLEVNASNLDLRGAQFLEGGHVTAERAKIELAQLSTARSFRISASAGGSQPCCPWTARRRCGEHELCFGGYEAVLLLWLS